MSRADIVLIGPPRVGKTTVAKLLAERLGVDHHQHDELRRAYYEEMGFDMDFNMRLFQEQGWPTMFQYWQVFQPHSIERFFEDYTGVLDLGGGAVVAAHPAIRRRLDAAFAPFANVVLLLPAADLEASMELLGERTEDADETESQRYFLESGDFERLAKHTVLTGGRTPEEVAEAVVQATQR